MIIFGLVFPLNILNLEKIRIHQNVYKSYVVKFSSKQTQ
jgi:hypothetical protein